MGGSVAIRVEYRMIGLNIPVAGAHTKDGGRPLIGPGTDTSGVPRWSCPLLLGRPLVAPSISEWIGTGRDVRSAVTIGPDTSVRPCMWHFYALRRPVLIRLSLSCGVRSEIVGISTRNRSYSCPVSTSELLALFSVRVWDWYRRCSF